MILTCPECATRFFVEADRLGPEGRQVRCSSCRASWLALPTAATEADEPLDLTAAPPPIDAPDKTRPAPGAVHQSFREQVSERRRTRQAVAAGVTWAVLAAGFALVILAAVVFRVQVVRLAPATAGAYAFARMPVNPTGFVIDEVQGGPALSGGRLATVVTGLQRNVESDARPAPPLRVSLIDNGGRSLTSQVVAPTAAPVLPGEARPFRISFIDAPPAAQVQVEFAFDLLHTRAPRPAETKAKAAARPAIHAGAPGPAHSAPLHAVADPGHGPAPTTTAVEAAKPLPANSPYALPPAAAQPHG